MAEFSPILIDGLQYCRWDRETMGHLRTGRVAAVHVTVAYWENARETLTRLGEWNRLFETFPDRIVRVESSAEIVEAARTGRTGIFFGFQNCSPIEDEIGLVEVYRRLGVLLMQLTYNNQSLLAAGCYEQSDAGITRFGRKVIEEMNRVGMVVDMSHSAERSALEAIDLSSRPIVVSHANPSSWHPSIRNKPDPLLKALAARGGLLGLSLYPFHLAGGGKCTLEAFCGMAARTVDLMGIDHVALGSDLCTNQPLQVLEWMRSGRWTKDLDYGEGSTTQASWPEQPSWFQTAADLPTVLDGLRGIGLSAADVKKIAGENWLRILDESATPR